MTPARLQSHFKYHGFLSAGTNKKSPSLYELKNTMTLPYRILLIFLLLGSVAFCISPWFTLQSINRAVVENDTEHWPELTRQKVLQEYTKKVLIGLLDLKMYSEIKQNPVESIRDREFGRKQAPQYARKLTAPNGFRNLLCGDLSSTPGNEIRYDNDCWALKGQLRWESLTRARVTYKNPETKWHSSLILERQGLFSWQAVAIELPVEAILDRFADSVGLNKEKTSNT